MFAPVRYLAAVAALLLWAQAADSRPILSGKVVGVTDGDTLTLLTADKRQVKIRPDGIDAPESGQPFGTKAKQALSAKVFGKAVTVEDRGPDKYGRTIGRVKNLGISVNQAMVMDGWAWHFTKYSDDETLATAEKAARGAKRGLWADPSPIPRWDWRDGERGGVATLPITGAADPAAATLTVYLTKTGEKYHAAGCRHLSKSRIPISLAEAKRRYTPCSVCSSPR